MILRTKCNSRGARVVQKSCRGARIGRRRDSGQTLIEVALMLPVLLFLTLGVFELGRYAFVSILVGNAARAGTAYGTQSLPQSVDAVGIQTAARNDYRNNGQNPQNLVVNSSVSCGCDVGGGIVSAPCTGSGAGVCGTGRWVAVLSVTASSTFVPLFTYSGIQSIALTRTSAVRVRAV
jgi:Flp pilus assembly protein TadG